MKRSLAGAWVGMCLVVFYLAACSQKTEGPLPTLEKLTPHIVCGDQLTTPVEISGDKLSPLGIDVATEKPGLAIPDITLQRIKDLDGKEVKEAAIQLANDPKNPTLADVSWTSAKKMVIKIHPQLKLPSGTYKVTATNKSGGAVVLDFAIVVVPRPTLEKVEADILCLAQDSREVVLQSKGKDFLRIFLIGGDAKPTAKFDSVELPIATLEECIDMPLPNGAKAQRCSVARVILPKGAVADGVQNVVVTNPSPAACHSEEAVTMAIVPPPKVATVAPEHVCRDDGMQSFTVTGEDILWIDRGLPAFKMGDKDAAIVDKTGCSSVAGTLRQAERCTQVTLTVDKKALDPGKQAVWVANPDPAGCASPGGISMPEGEPAVPSVEVHRQPIVTGLGLVSVCSSGEFGVVGTDFEPTATIYLKDSTGALASVHTRVVDDKNLVGTLDGTLEPGDYSVWVQNFAACLNPVSPVFPIKVVPAPIPFFVDPSVVYRGIKVEATLYASGVTGGLQSLKVRPTGTGATPKDMSFDSDADNANRFFFTIDKESLDAGEYDVLIADASCTAVFIQAFKVTGTLSIDVLGMSPRFGSEAERTPTTITSSNPAAAGKENFEAVPRVYLSPQDGSKAMELHGVSFVDAFKLTAVVPEGLPPGKYDLVVVNPKGTVGVATGAFEVVVASPPVITTLTPGQRPNQTGQNVTITGANFRTGATVTAACRKPGSTTEKLLTGVVLSGGGPTTLPTAWDLSSVGIDELCVIRVTNTDGTFADFSALSITNSSGNLNAFQEGKPMNLARRGLAAAALPLNSVRRFLYAIGGDDGNDANVTDTVESIEVDAFGNMIDKWLLQRSKLPKGRAFTSAAMVGKCIYVPGGRDKDLVIHKTVYRACQLDPFDATQVPEIFDLNLAWDKSGTSSLGSGVWFYRVAALMKGDVADNPGGEALPSEPFLIQLPPGLRKFHVTIYWDVINGAEKYRIYRPRTANAKKGDECLVAEISASSGSGVPQYKDEGGDCSDPSAKPLPEGSLGTWHEVEQLTTPRMGAGIVSVPDPTDSTRVYLYVIGGRDENGVFHKDYEWAVTHLDETLRNRPNAFGTGGDFDATKGRMFFSAVYMDNKRAEVIPSDRAWVYLLPGETSTTDNDTRVLAFEIDGKNGPGSSKDGRLIVTGVLDEASSTTQLGKAYGGVGGNGYLYGFGGDKDLNFDLASISPSNSSSSAQLCTAVSAGGQCTLVPPNTKNWNALGSGTISRARAYLGIATEGSFIFVLGGQTGADGPTTTTNTTDQTNF